MAAVAAETNKSMLTVLFLLLQKKNARSSCFLLDFVLDGRESD